MNTKTRKRATLSVDTRMLPPFPSAARPVSDGPGPNTTGNPAPVSISVDLIDFSPLNYRKHRDPTALAAFAEGVKAQGIISPVTVRIVTPGRYELVVGEWRLMAARLAGLSHLPAMVKSLSDGQVEEMQLAENLGREDAHPMDDASAIDRMYNRGLTTDEIAARLGKPKTFVYQRRKLSGLIPDFQEMFLADLLTLGQALDIALLDTEAQGRFVDSECKDWKTEGLYINSLIQALSSYKGNLNKALFDLNDATLLPEMGACSVCRHNTAFGGLLIPDESAQARCGKMSCFEQKRTLHLTRQIGALITEHHPVALILSRNVPPFMTEALATIEGAAELKRYTQDEITVHDEPEAPSKADYTDEDWDEEEEDDDNESRDDDSDDNDERGEDADQDADRDEERETGKVKSEPAGRLDEEGYKAALGEYEEEMAVYSAAIAEGKALKGFFLSAESLRMVYFFAEPPARNGHTGERIKIKDLIKAGTDTVDDLESEINRIKLREVRNKQLDKEKVQKEIHAQLKKLTTAEGAALVLTAQARMATRWLAWSALSYQSRDAVETALDISVGYSDKQEAVYTAFEALTDEQFTYLIHMSVLSQSESSSPSSVSGYFLVKLAEGAGIDVPAIGKAQTGRAETRQDRQEVAIALYKKRIKKHQRRKANAA